MQRPALLVSKQWAAGRSSLLGYIQNRKYVGLAYSQPSSTIQTVDRSLKSFEHTSTGTTTPSTISTVGQDASTEDYSEPAFEIVSSGVGSALLIKMPPETEITASTGSALGSSGRVTSKLTLDGNAVKATGRKLIGDPLFYQKFYTKQQPGDILLAPNRMGEITTIQLRGSTKYVLRRDAFLAKTEKVTLDVGMDGVKGKHTGLANKLVHTVTGPGTIAISHYGGLYRLSLAAGEEYLVNPRNLIFWDKRTAPTRLHPSDPIVPSPRSPWRRYAVVRNIAESPSFQPKLQYMNSVVKTLRNFILGAPDFVKLKGPGDFYVASRVEPRFERSRLLNAIAAINDSSSQLFEQSTIFPDPAPGQEATSSHLAAASALLNFGKKKHHPGYAEKSTNGKPSFYAEVGPNGKVTFISTKE
ncbi:mitochondrial biogenesis AIM24-domain-containing protein [Halteromyces radiatus]|uniref:mitochondrial biogenesis AIM24-domain-containing protein n=1 Tax=Halteromyces radiatus TaxID=101107 RepID=UPI00221F1F07|nr:mitochondrial biogenesis AIM24-domain-containing protein [Halteromyces radiatus]KAI8097522.1 mitochondrial biogenesis AIM24-domain-containing protein [Halteromyces radiatus]